MGKKPALYFEKHRLHELSSMVADRIDELFDALGLRLYQSGNAMVGTCPIHGGDRAGAFNIYPNGERVKGWWICQTKHCEQTFRQSIVGFTRGVLSHQKFGWDGKKKKRMVSHIEAVDFLLRFLGIKIEDVKIDYARAEEAEFEYTVQMLNRTPPVRDAIGDRESIRTKLSIPAEFYLNRGYLASTLDEYDIGIMRETDHELYGRVIVPVYDPEGNHVIGMIGRSLNPECESCGKYHNPSLSCPSILDIDGAKWLVSKDFVDKHYLYNFWKAKESIFQTKTVVIVEGAGDVWRLREGGIDNCVAIFGNKIRDAQEIKFQTCGAASFIIVRDMDDAGAALVDQAKSMFSSYGRVHIFDQLPTKDVGDMTADQVRSLILPFVQARQRKQ